MPLSVFRLMVTPLFPRLRSANMGLTLLTNGGVYLSSSPQGGSTFITSAPRSARILPQKGPAMNRERSRTRMFSNGLTI